MVYMGNNVVDRGRHRHHRHHHHQEQQNQHHQRQQHLLHHNHGNNKPHLDEKDSRFDSNNFYWDDNQTVSDVNIVDPALYLSVVGKPLLYSTGTPPDSDLLFTDKSDTKNLLLTSSFDNDIYVNKTPTNNRVDAATQVSDCPKTIRNEQCENHYQVSMLSQAIRLSSPCCNTMENRHDLGRLFHLKPLGNQVGGHTRLMVLSSKSDQSTDSSLSNLDLDVGQMIVCKPLNMGELQFYLKLEEQNRRNRSVRKISESHNGGRVRTRRNRDLSEFVPQFEGVMALSRDDVTVQGRNAASAQMLYCRSCSDDKNNRIDEFQTARLMTLPDPSSTSDKQLFLLLENLTSKRKYKLPCILDLKMGVRQYSECATMQKRLRQTLKCRMTTSATLGVRLCGMQIYQGCCSAGDNRNAYSLLKRDKYWGRRLDVDGFERALRLFFSKSTASSDLDDENEDGDATAVDSYRLDVVKGVLRRLKHLRNAIIKNAAAATSDASQASSSRALRFYSCSLLIVYEGAPSSSSPPKMQISVQRPEQPHDQHIHDCHSGETNDSISPPINHIGSNVRSHNATITTTGNDMDRRNRHRCSSSLCYCTPPSSYSDSTFPWSDDVDSEEDGRSYSSSGCSSSSEDDSDTEDDDDDAISSRSADTTPYDVRIIDFANASFFSRDNPSAAVPDTDDTAKCECSRDDGGSETAADPCSPDTGFLQGLRTVRRVLSQILRDPSHHK